MTGKTRNITIAIALVIIIGGIYYYKKQMVVAPAPQSVDVSSVVPTENPTSSDVTEALPEDVAAGTAVTASANDSLDQQRFNNAMNNARMDTVNKNYKSAIKQYQLALKYQKDADTAYIGLYVVYGAQGNWVQARVALDKAIALAPTNADYWKWKIGLLDEKTDTPYEALVSLYNDGMKVVNPAYKINLVTYFARVAENNTRYNDAIAQWELAKTIVPANTSMYQSEIDHLNTLK